MGISLSSRRRNNHRPHHPYPNYYYHPDASALPPLPPPPHEHSYSVNPTYPTALPAPQHPPPPPPPPASFGYGNPNPMPAGRFGYHCHYYQQHPPYFANQPNGWVPMMRSAIVVPPQPQPPPPYVEHQNAKKVRNDVNVHKDTVRLETDDLNPGLYLVSFVFDALFDGSFTIFFFAKEESNCKLVPQFPEVYTPIRVPFWKGLGQKFLQPSGTGVDLGFFLSDDLSKPSPDDVFPLVITAETFSPTNSADATPMNSISDESGNKQITQAILEKSDDGSFKVKVSKQILWINKERYEIRELYGIGSPSTEAESVDDDDSGKECVICMTEPKDTAILPCRHLCLCSECAKELRLQSNKCPICRQAIEELLEIKVNG